MSKYNIQIASQLSGVGQHTLRAWEKRYKAVIPSRDAADRRLYSDEDVEKLKLLSDLCTCGSSISTIANKTIDELKELLNKMGKNPSKLDVAQVEDDPEKAHEVLANLLLALEFYKLDVISHEIKKLKLSLSPKDLAMNILSPLLYEVGERTSNGKMTIAQEHALSAIIRFHIGQIIYQHFDIKHKNQNIVALSTPVDEHHEFGIMMATLMCCHYGVNFYYFGPNMPHDAFVDAAKSVGANILILGTVLSLDSKRQIELDKYLENALLKLNSDQVLWLGGSGRFTSSKFENNKKFKYLSSISELNKLLQALK